MESKWRLKAESFSLYSDINRYKDRGAYDKEDILEYFFYGGYGARTIFGSKTQGEDYHIYILAIACLIESRFPKYAITFGDINREQAQVAVDWANSILKEPINLPVRVDGVRLMNRLIDIRNNSSSSENGDMLYAFKDLIITDDSGQYGEYIREKFTKAEIIDYFTNELKEYTSATMIGAQRLMIDFLNQGNEFEDLCDICCINEDRAKYDAIEFAKAIASIRVFIPEDKRKMMDIPKKPAEKPTTVMEQFMSVFMDMGGGLGRYTNRYIPLEDGLSIIKKKFKEADEMEKIIRESCEDKEKNLLNKLDEIISEKYADRGDTSDIYDNEDYIYNTEMFIYWNENSILSEEIGEFLNSLKEFIEKEFRDEDKANGLILESCDKNNLIKFIIEFTRQNGVILTKDAWAWIEEERDLDVLKKISLMAFIKSNKHINEVVTALLENKSMFYKYIIN